MRFLIARARIVFILEQQRKDLGFDVNQLATEALQNSQPSAWFEVLYAQAKGDIAQIPWAKLAGKYAY